MALRRPHTSMHQGSWPYKIATMKQTPYKTYPLMRDMSRPPPSRSPTLSNPSVTWSRLPPKYNGFLRIPCVTFPPNFVENRSSSFRVIQQTNKLTTMKTTSYKQSWLVVNFLKKLTIKKFRPLPALRRRLQCKMTTLLHCALSLAAQCIVIGPVCSGRALWLCWSVTHDNSKLRVSIFTKLVCTWK